MRTARAAALELGMDVARARANLVTLAARGLFEVRVGDEIEYLYGQIGRADTLLRSLVHTQSRVHCRKSPRTTACSGCATRPVPDKSRHRRGGSSVLVGKGMGRFFQPDRTGPETIAEIFGHSDVEQIE
jgi:hypothetical protein